MDLEAVVLEHLVLSLGTGQLLLEFFKFVLQSIDQLLSFKVFKRWVKLLICTLFVDPFAKFAWLRLLLTLQIGFHSALERF